MTRILVSQVGTVGGGPRLLYEVSRALARRPDVEVHVTGYAGSELRELQAGLGLPACDAPADPPSRPGAVLAHIRYSLALARYVRRHRVDAAVVVMGSPRQILPALALRLAGPTVLGGRHDPAPHHGEASRLIVATHMFLQRYMSHGLLTYSEATARSIREQVAHPDRVYQTVIAAFGEGLAPGPRPAPGRPVRVGCFGRIVAYKGLDRLVEAMRLLRADGVEVELQLHGRGEIDGDLAAALDAVGAVVENRWIADDEVEAIVAGYDVLALPYGEASQSGVVGYAMRHGVPVVATPLPGLAEQVDEPGVGLLAADMTPRAFADAVRRLVDDPATYGRCSAAGPVAVAGPFGWDRVADDIVTAVEDLERTRGRR